MYAQKEYTQVLGCAVNVSLLLFSWVAAKWVPRLLAVCKPSPEKTKSQDLLTLILNLITLLFLNCVVGVAVCLPYFLETAHPTFKTLASSLPLLFLGLIVSGALLLTFLLIKGFTFILPKKAGACLERLAKAAFIFICLNYALSFFTETNPMQKPSGFILEKLGWGKRQDATISFTQPLCETLKLQGIPVKNAEMGCTVNHVLVLHSLGANLTMRLPTLEEEKSYKKLFIIGKENILGYSWATPSEAQAVCSVASLP